MLLAPRRCWCLKRLGTGKRNDLLLVRIDPPLSAMSDMPPGIDLSLVILATRYVGNSLFPVNKWPLDVHVALPLVTELERRETLRADEFKSVAWAELYRTEEDAQRKGM
jgi:hypothetical protein